MKCSKCGKEFGDGINCQHCGVDRVTGLANFNGYQGNAISSQPASQNGALLNTMVCYACGEIIPIHSKFCPYCSKNLYVTCPKCGNTYSSQFPACSNCGTNRELFYRQQEGEKQKAKRDKEEKEKKQRDWEQSPEGQAKMAIEKKKQRQKEKRNTISSIILWIGNILAFSCVVMSYTTDNPEVQKIGIALIFLGSIPLYLLSAFIAN